MSPPGPPGGAFAVRGGALHAEGVPLERIAAEVGTPTYVYAAGALRARYRALAAALAGLPATVCYAVKANPNLAVIATLAAEGAGADTVSGGEIERALAAGVPPSRIVYAGVAKTDDEIRLALGVGILQFNVESLDELDRVAALAAAAGVRAPVALRINPDIGAGGHDKIATGRRGDKFGLPIADAHAAFAAAMARPSLEPLGLHVHIGSQVTDLGAFGRAYARAAGLARELRAAGVPLRRLDLGGGLGVACGEAPAVEPGAYVRTLRRALDGLDAELILEPGRWLVAEAGLLLARVVATKEADGRRFLILDAGMNALLRPAMYGSRHPIQPVRAAPGPAVPHDVVGPICESGDSFGRDHPLPRLRAGDLVAVLAAGAYGAAMASDYNSRPAPAEVLVDGARSAVVRRRVTAVDRMRDEAVPGWLRPAAALG